MAPSGALFLAPPDVHPDPGHGVVRVAAHQLGADHAAGTGRDRRDSCDERVPSAYWRLPHHGDSLRGCRAAGACRAGGATAPAQGPMAIAPIGRPQCDVYTMGLEPGRSWAGAGGKNVVSCAFMR